MDADKNKIRIKAIAFQTIGNQWNCCSPFRLFQGRIRVEHRPNVA